MWISKCYQYLIWQCFAFLVLRFTWQFILTHTKLCKTVYNSKSFINNLAHLVLPLFVTLFLEELLKFYLSIDIWNILTDEENDNKHDIVKKRKKQTTSLLQRNHDSHFFKFLCCMRLINFTFWPCCWYCFYLF